MTPRLIQIIAYQDYVLGLDNLGQMWRGRESYQGATFFWVLVSDAYIGGR